MYLVLIPDEEYIFTKKNMTVEEFTELYEAWLTHCDVVKVDDGIYRPVGPDPEFSSINAALTCFEHHIGDYHCFSKALWCTNEETGEYEDLIEDADDYIAQHGDLYSI